MEQQTTDFAKSKFNAAFLKLERINRIKQAIIDCRYSKDYSGWFTGLLTWRSEINERLKKKTREDVADTYELLIKSAFEYIPTRPLNPFYQSRTPKQYFILIDFLLGKYEIFLGKMESKMGISLVDDDDPRFALGNG